MFDLTYPQIILLSGISNSGKTTFSNELRDTFKVVNKDKVREAIAGHSRNYNYEQEVHRVSMDAIILHISRGDSVIYDFSNITSEARSKVLTISDWIGCRISCIYFPISFKEALERNISREDPVDPKLIAAQFDILEYPEIDEGFEKVMEVYEDLKKIKPAHYFTKEN
jgi:predicted kinase